MVHSNRHLSGGRKEFFRFMNKVYSEGLISKEFVTDVNSQQYIQNYTSGSSGFMDSNDDSMDHDNGDKKDSTYS